ncbi:MAG: ribonuclease HI family protein [Armatimonadetes bacterium]|nr:ribonuclease HI family protein [Armatimonadota bacterium]
MSAGKRAVLRTDGASRGNPGPAAIGIVIADDAGRTLRELGETIGVATNNVAEYQALLRGLREASDLGISALEIRLDSELLVHQIRGTYRVRNGALIPLHAEVTRRLRDFPRVEIKAVPRAENRRADALANRALDGGGRQPARAAATVDTLAELALAGDVDALRDALRTAAPAIVRDALLAVVRRVRDADAAKHP